MAVVRRKIDDRFTEANRSEMNGKIFSGKGRKAVVLFGHIEYYYQTTVNRIYGQCKCTIIDERML